MNRKRWEDLVCAPTWRAGATVSDLSTWRITREHACLGASSSELCRYLITRFLGLETINYVHRTVIKAGFQYLIGFFK